MAHEKKLIIKQNELKQLNAIRDVGFRKTRSFTDYSLASGIQTLDLSHIQSKKIKKLFVDFLYQCTSRKNRTLLISLIDDVAIIRILHGVGYSWSYDVEGEFTSWLLKTYKVNKKSKTYRNIVYCNSILNF